MLARSRGFTRALRASRRSLARPPPDRRGARRTPSEAHGTRGQAALLRLPDVRPMRAVRIRHGLPHQLRQNHAQRALRRRERGRRLRGQAVDALRLGRGHGGAEANRTRASRTGESARAHRPAAERQLDLDQDRWGSGSREAARTPSLRGANGAEAIQGDPRDRLDRLRAPPRAMTAGSPARQQHAFEKACLEAMDGRRFLVTVEIEPPDSPDPSALAEAGRALSPGSWTRSTSPMARAATAICRARRRRRCSPRKASRRCARSPAATGTASRCRATFSAPRHSACGISSASQATMSAAATTRKRSRSSTSIPSRCLASRGPCATAANSPPAGRSMRGRTCSWVRPPIHSCRPTATAC